MAQCKIQGALSNSSLGRVTGKSNPSAGDWFKFTGRELDTATGLQYHRARYYDAALGRWTQEDPIGFAAGDSNLYRYVANGPTNATDPTGLVGPASVYTPSGSYNPYTGWHTPPGKGRHDKAFEKGFHDAFPDSLKGVLDTTSFFDPSPLSEYLGAGVSLGQGKTRQATDEFMYAALPGALGKAGKLVPDALGKAGKLGKIGGKIDDVCPTPNRYRDKIDELVAGSKSSQRDLGNLPTKPTSPPKSTPHSGYHVAPKEITGIPGLTPAKGRTPVQGGGGHRKRWKDTDGNIFEWDSQHGALEKYNSNGRHLGEFDPTTGSRTKNADPSRDIRRYL